MKQTYRIEQDGTGAYHFYGTTTQEDGGTSGREYAHGTDLETVRERGVAEMLAEALRHESTVVEGGTIEEAHAKVLDCASLSVRGRATTTRTDEEIAALGRPKD